MSDNVLSSDKPKNSEIADFGQALFHSGVENPLNGFVQLVNKTTHTSLPELQIAGAPEENSWGTAAGNLAGTVADYALLSKIAGSTMGDIGGSGLAGNALRAGIVGGVYSGIFTPSDPNSDSFFSDRLANAGVGAATFASMAAAANGLGKTGLFAVPEVRSLAGYVALGGLSGAAGGVAHAESSAILKDGRFLPSLGNLGSDIETYAAFGAAFGALGYADSKLDAKTTTEKFDATRTWKDGTTKPASAIVTSDANGQPLKVSADLPSSDSWSSSRLNWQSVKMMDGTWSSSGNRDSFVVPDLTDAKIDSSGNLQLMTSDGDLRSFNKDGSFVKSNPENAAAKAAADANFNAKMAQFHEQQMDLVRDGKREVTLEYPSKQNGAFEIADTRATMDPTSNEVSKISFNPADTKYSNIVGMTRGADGTWSINMANADGYPSVYTWKGDVKPNINAGGKVDSFSFTSANGTSSEIGQSANSVPETFKSIVADAKFSELDPNWRYIRMDDQGNLLMRSGSGTLDGKPLSNVGKEISIKPGDAISLRFDIGDRGPNIVNPSIQWSKALDGTLQINGEAITPGKAIDLNILTTNLHSSY